GIRHAPITAWTWRPRPTPALDYLPPRGRRWEMERYRAYQRWLASRTMGDVFDRTAGFLALAADIPGCGDSPNGAEAPGGGATPLPTPRNLSPADPETLTG